MNTTIHYADAGVLTNEALGLESLLRSIRKTEDFRRTRPVGRSVLDIGYFANVIEIGRGIGLAMTTDGVGSKVLIAELMRKYDTIGIDCVAMNVNDLICVGAEPVSMLDYIAIEKATPRVLEEIGKGLLEGARQANINIVGGEISQLRDLIKGATPDGGLDLVGMCVGTVALDSINVGQSVAPGDIIIGLQSTGVHSNGLTLARKALLAPDRLSIDSYVSELGRTVGDELLEPTRIYVNEVMDLLSQGLPIRAMVNITSDGFLNLCRIKPDVSFRLTHLPTPQPIFSLIQKFGNVSDEEMYRVFNMGVGFCVIVPNDPQVIRLVCATLGKHGTQAYQIGEVVADPARRVFIPEKHLVGQGDSFRQDS